VLITTERFLSNTRIIILSYLYDGISGYYHALQSKQLINNNNNSGNIDISEYLGEIIHHQ
jgi:hypothetical protein